MTTLRVLTRLVGRLRQSRGSRDRPHPPDGLPPLQPVTAPTEENARIGYQVAIDLWIHEGGLIWARFNAMLVANSIVVAAIGLALFGDNRSLPGAVLLAAAGVVLCVIWWLLTKRGVNYSHYLILSARELGEQHLADPVRTVARGAEFVDGTGTFVKDGQTGYVAFTIGGRQDLRRRSELAYRLTLVQACSVVIAVFGILYFSAAILVLLDCLDVFDPSS